MADAMGPSSPSRERWNTLKISILAHLSLQGEEGVRASCDRKARGKVRGRAGFIQVIA